jgi:hypothetical protein
MFTLCSIFYQWFTDTFNLTSYKFDIFSLLCPISVCWWCTTKYTDIIKLCIFISNGYTNVLPSDPDTMRNICSFCIFSIKFRQSFELINVVIELTICLNWGIVYLQSSFDSSILTSNQMRTKQRWASQVKKPYINMWFMHLNFGF